MHPVLFVSGHRVNTDNLKIKSTRGQKHRNKKKNSADFTNLSALPRNKISLYLCFYRHAVSFSSSDMSGLVSVRATRTSAHCTRK